VGVTDEGAQTDVRNINDETPETPGEVVTPVTAGTDKGRSSTGRTGKELTGTDKDERAGRKTDVTLRSVVLSEFNKMMDEIDASALFQEELRETDPTLASASSFLSVVTGGAGRKKNAQTAKVAKEEA